MKMRAMVLEKALKELLGDPNGVGMVKKLYEHPLIDGLFQGTYQGQKGGRFWSNLPSYNERRSGRLRSQIRCQFPRIDTQSEVSI